MTSLPTVCILAGGRGTRLGSLTDEVPKPLVEVAGKPFLAHQIHLLARHGAKEVVLCVGHLGSLIESVIGHERDGLRIRYSYDDPGLNGTLGAIRKAKPLLGSRFLVLYGDTFLRIDYEDVALRWEASGLPAVMTVLYEPGHLGRSNSILDQEFVTAHDKHQPTAEMKWIDYGLGGLTAAALSCVPEDTTDLSDLYGVLAKTHQLLGILATERFYEIGTPESLAETDLFLKGLAEPEGRTRMRSGGE